MCASNYTKYDRIYILAPFPQYSVAPDAAECPPSLCPLPILVANPSISAFSSTPESLSASPSSYLSVVTVRLLPRQLRIEGKEGTRTHRVVMCTFAAGRILIELRFPNEYDCEVVWKSSRPLPWERGPRSCFSRLVRALTAKLALAREGRWKERPTRDEEGVDVELA